MRLWCKLTLQGGCRLANAVCTHAKRRDLLRSDGPAVLDASKATRASRAKGKAGRKSSRGGGGLSLLACPKPRNGQQRSGGGA